jgi:hypothetical protein
MVTQLSSSKQAELQPLRALLQERGIHPDQV